MGKDTYRVLVSICVSWLALAAGTVQAGDKPLILAVHPYLPAAEIQTRFTPLANHLATAVGRPVSVRVGGNYEEHIEAIGNDQVDIAFLGPVPFVSTTKRFGAKPLLAGFEVGGQPHLYGVIVTRKDSPLQSLQELADKRFAFGDAESTMSHIVPRYMLMEAGIPKGLPATHKFLGAHKNVALAVLAGDYDAGAMKKEVFDEFEPQGLRALAVSPGVPDHLFVTRADLEPAEVQRLRDAMQQVKDSPQAARILNSLHKGLTALVPVESAAYDELRKIVAAVEAASQ